MGNGEPGLIKLTSRRSPRLWDKSQPASGSSRKKAYIDVIGCSLLGYGGDQQASVVGILGEDSETC